jgi:hypothetical protein
MRGGFRTLARILIVDSVLVILGQHGQLSYDWWCEAVRH